MSDVAASHRERRCLHGAALLVIALCGVLSRQTSAQDVTVRRYGSQSQEALVQIREIKSSSALPMVGEQPFGFALMPKVETPDESWDVVFLRFNLFVGSHRCVYGLDLGFLGNMAMQEMGGLGIAGLFNDIGSSSGALDVAGIVNHADLDFSGLQLAAGFNWTEGAFTGLGIALANKAGGLGGVQIGAVNFAEKGSGLQIGVVNFSEQLEGFQIGAININCDSSVPVFPILNFAF